MCGIRKKMCTFAIDLPKPFAHEPLASWKPYAHYSPAYQRTDAPRRGGAEGGVEKNTILNNNETTMCGGVRRMTSLEIAEVAGKNHFDVLRAIRKMEPAWEKVILTANLQSVSTRTRQDAAFLATR